MGQFRVPPEFGPESGAKCKCDSRNIDQADNNALTDVFRRLDTDVGCSSPEVQAKKIDTIRSMIRSRIHSTGTDRGMSQPHNNQGRIDENFFDYVPEELIEQLNNSFNHISNFVPATEACMRFSPVLPAIPSSSQPVPCSNSNSNSNDITNMTSIENTGLLKGSTIVEGTISLGG